MTILLQLLTVSNSYERFAMLRSILLSFVLCPIAFAATPASKPSTKPTAATKPTTRATVKAKYPKVRDDAPQAVKDFWASRGERVGPYVMEQVERLKVLKGKEAAECRQKIADARKGLLPCYDYIKEGNVEKGTIALLPLIYVSQVIDGKNAIVELVNEGKQAVWLSGFDTSEFVDGKMYGGQAEAVWIKGTKRYQTAIGGSKTVYILERFDINDYLEQP